MSKLKSYMQINLSFQNVLGRGGMIGEICGGGGGNTTYCKKLLYCKAIQVFKEKGTSSQKKNYASWDSLSLQFSLHAAGANDHSEFVGVLTQPSTS